MALIKCPDCGTEISDKAEDCVKCGRPTDKPDDEKKAPAILMPGMVLALIGGTLFFGMGGLYGWMVGLLAMVAGAVMTVVGLIQKPK